MSDIRIQKVMQARVDGKIVTLSALHDFVERCLAADIPGDAEVRVGGHEVFMRNVEIPAVIDLVWTVEL